MVHRRPRQLGRNFWEYKLQTGAQGENISLYVTKECEHVLIISTSVRAFLRSRVSPKPALRNGSRQEVCKGCITENEADPRKKSPRLVSSLPAGGEMASCRAHDEVMLASYHRIEKQIEEKRA